VLGAGEEGEEVRMENRMLKVRIVVVSSSMREEAKRPSRSLRREEWRIVSVGEGEDGGEEDGGGERWRFERAVSRSGGSEGGEDVVEAQNVKYRVKISLKYVSWVLKSRSLVEGLVN
jgi:hypothetical protein